MVVICHKPAQIDNMARPSTDTVYMTTYNGTGLFKIFLKLIIVISVKQLIM